MFGLIEALDYTATKARLIANDGRVEDAIDAVEWELQHQIDFSDYPVVLRKSQEGAAVLAHHIPGRIIVIFTFEVFDEDMKILLLDAWVPEAIDGYEN